MIYLITVVTTQHVSLEQLEVQKRAILEWIEFYEGKLSRNQLSRVAGEGKAEYQRALEVVEGMIEDKKR